MLTCEGSPQRPGVISVVMAETQDADMTSWNEADFEEKSTYIVKDQPLEDVTESHRKTRAERSLPRNLSLRRRQDPAEVRSPAAIYLV